VPIHKHLVEQGFLKDVEERRRIGKPLFYEPARARGGKTANPSSNSKRSMVDFCRPKEPLKSVGPPGANNGHGQPLAMAPTFSKR
jgi:hypothetical protein